MLVLSHYQLFQISSLYLQALYYSLRSGGILVSETYLRETPGLAAQSIAQDWFDLVVAVPVAAGFGPTLSRGLEERTFFPDRHSGIPHLHLSSMPSMFHSTGSSYSIASRWSRELLAHVSFVEDNVGDVKSWFDTDRSVTVPIFYLLFVDGMF